MKIYIKEQEIELKKTFRSYIIYEAITEKPFQPQNLTDLSIYFYSVILSSKQDINLSYDEFIEWLDENYNSYQEFITWINDNNKVEQTTTKKKSDKKKV